MSDFWGAPFEADDIVPEPRRLLQEQADLLEGKTDGRIVGEISQHIFSSDGIVMVSLYLSATIRRLLTYIKEREKEDDE